MLLFRLRSLSGRGAVSKLVKLLSTAGSSHFLLPHTEGPRGSRGSFFEVLIFDESTRQLDQSGENRRSKALLSVAHFNVQFGPSLD